MMASRPEGRQGGAKHEVPVTRGMDDVLVWSCQLYPQGCATTPTTRAAAAAEVSTWLRAARVALDETAIAQAIVQYNGLGLQQLAQFIAHHPAGESAMPDVLLGQGISMGDHLLLALLEPGAPVGDTAQSALREHVSGSLVDCARHSSNGRRDPEV